MHKVSEADLCAANQKTIENFELYKKHLSANVRFNLIEAHTAAHISEVLTCSLSEFSINSENVLAVVTDNGSNISPIHTKLGSSLSG